MASERFANTLPFSGVKDGHDAVVVALHTFMIEAGYKCIGIGEEVCLVYVILPQKFVHDVMTCFTLTNVVTSSERRS